MSIFWRIFGFSVFLLPKGVRLLQCRTLCDQTAVAQGVEVAQLKGSFCRPERITIIIMPDSFDGTYGNELGAEVKRYRKRFFRDARCVVKIRAADISVSIISLLLGEVDRD